jgi:hypothetical protein
MEYSRASVGRIPLDDFVSIVHQIYSPHDMNRSIWDVWCHALHHAGAVAEKIRNGASPSSLSEDADVADLALWLFTILHKLSGEIGKRRSVREPPEEPLIKISAGISELLVLRSGKEGLGRPTSIDEWQDAVGQELAAILPGLSLSDVASRVLEELAETSDAMIRMYCYTQEGLRAGEPIRRRSRLEAQLADLFVWLFALVERIGLGSGVETRQVKVLLSETIWARYGSEDGHCFCCRHCKGRVCSCRIILVPATYPVEEFLPLAKEL